MKKHRLYIASGLIALTAFSPILSIADTYRYRYVISALTPENQQGGEVIPDGYKTVATEWEDVGEIYGCSEPTPLVETIPSGVTFEQTSDCSQDQERTVTTYKIEDGSESLTVIGEPKVETRTLNGVKNYSEAIGTNPAFSIYFDAPKVATSKLLLKWNSNGAINYKLKASDPAAGISTSYVDMGSRSFKTLYPTEKGNYTYTVMGTNASGEITEAQVQIEIIDFSIKNFTVQETEVSAGGDIHLSWSAPSDATLILTGYGDVTGKSSIVVKAPDMTGTHSWFLSAEKEINGEIVEVSANSNTYEIIGAPVIYEAFYPKVDKVFADGNFFTVYWASSSEISRYTIQSDNAKSGVPTTPVEVSTTGKSNESSIYIIYPAKGEYGKYTYTIKGYNKFGGVGDLKITATAVPFPNIYSVKPNNYILSPGENITLQWSAVGVSSIEIRDKQSKQVVYSGTGSGNDYANINNVTVPVGNTLGNAYWNITVKGFNGSSAYQSASVYIVADPILNITLLEGNIRLGNKFRVNTQIDNAETVTLTGSSDESGWATTGNTENTSSSYYEGTPTAAGDYDYTIKVTNSAGKSISKSFTVHVTP